MHIGGEIINEELLSFVFGLFGDDGAAEVQHQHLHLAGLPRLPQVAGNVEEQGLEEEDEANPLIIFMIFDGVALTRGTDARVRHIDADPLGGQTVGNRKRRVNPTIRIHYISRNAFNDTIDGVANVLP